MKTWSILLMSLFAFSAGAEGFLDFREEGFTKKELKEKKWLLNMGLDYMQYPTSLPSYSGEHLKVKREEDYDIYGLNLGIGREFVIGAGFSTTLRTGGFYNKTFSKNIGKAAEEVDIDLANIRTAHMVYGGEASAAINYMVENSVVNFQPFVEFGLGTGIGEIEKEYTFEGIPAENKDPENYKAKSREGFNYARTSVGLNFISPKGLTSYIKASRMVMDVNQRKISGSSDEDSSFDKKEDDLKESKEILSASLGIGFLF